MRGTDKIVTDDLYQGTAKSAEGYLASVLFSKANEEGCQILVNWQDQDSSSEKSFREVYGDGASARVMKCGGHVGRAHGNALKDLKGKKTLQLLAQLDGHTQFHTSRNEDRSEAHSLTHILCQHTAAHQ